MPKIGLEPVRRRQIIAATHACLTRPGLEATSLPVIAREAAIAPSLIQHYFRDRDDLLTETFRALCCGQSDRFRRGLARAITPQDRLAVLLEAMTPPCRAATCGIMRGFVRVPMTCATRAFRRCLATCPACRRSF